MKNRIWFGESFTFRDFLKLVFYRAQEKSIKIKTTKVHDIFYRLKKEYNEFDVLSFYITGNSHHSRELERYLSNFSTYNILGIPMNANYFKVREESEKELSKRYAELDLGFKDTIEKVTNSLSQIVQENL